MEYGSSFQATRAFGVVRSLYDTVYNMNMAHLTRAHKTVFEHLDDAGLRTACTTWLIYRGRTRHDPSGASVYRRIAEAAQFNHPVWGARELFYADLFDSRNTGCTSALGMPGQRDRHTGCVGAYLVEHDLFDFLLFSLPTTTPTRTSSAPTARCARSRRPTARSSGSCTRPAASTRSSSEHAVIVMSDHSQTAVEGRVNLAEAFADARVLAPSDPAPTEAELAVSPAARSAMVYALDRERRDELVAGARGGPRRRAGDRPGRDPGRRGRAGPQRSRRAALPAGRRGRRRARTGLVGRGRARHARAGARGRRRWRATPTPTPSGGCGRRSSARTPATCWSRPRPASSSSTGAAPTTWAAAATARCTATTPRGCCCSAGSTPPERGSGRSPT